MNYEKARLQTFYHYTHLTPTNKYLLVKKGCHAQQIEQEILINCVNCKEIFSLNTIQIQDILLHNCLIGDPDFENIPIPSPYDGPMDTSVENDLNYEEFRLATFSNWPHDTICDTSTLANSGFFYFDNYDRVKCYYCHFSLSNWKVGADPLKAHETFRPICQTIKHRKQLEVKEFLRSLRTEFMELLNVRLSDDLNDNNVVNDNDNNANSSDICISPPSENENPLHITTIEALLQSQLFRNAENLNIDKIEILTVATERFKNGKPFKDLNDLIVTALDYRKDQEEILRQLSSMTANYNRLKDEKECKICFANQMSVLFNPCRHMFTCEECAHKVDVCPYCQQRIASKISILFA